MANKFEFLARWGYAARGVVYITLGLIALLGSSAGEEASTHGALSNLLGQPFGRFLLGTVAIGLVGHVLWRLAQALLNADNQNNSLKGYLARGGNLASGIINGTLALAAARLVMASGGSSNGEGGPAAWLMQQPFGRFLVGALGLIVVAAGAVQAWRGISGKYRERLQLPSGRSDLLGGVSVSVSSRAASYSRSPVGSSCSRPWWWTQDRQEACPRRWTGCAICHLEPTSTQSPLPVWSPSVCTASSKLATAGSTHRSRQT
ncbi:uncharacterized protein DUF1206 [Rhizobium sp. PP-F2F-G20b]|nr:uncharacterized protein DUF1206 [Rhizobium sp. PP-F2F-G20b]